jgi:threonine dehydrogenase-like Zn-dependent dehydrogenase
LWKRGDAPSQVLQWAVEALAKAGTLAIIGVYPETMNRFPIGQAVEKNRTPHGQLPSSPLRTAPDRADAHRRDRSGGGSDQDHAAA